MAAVFGLARSSPAMKSIHKREYRNLNSGPDHEAEALLKRGRSIHILISRSRECAEASFPTLAFMSVVAFTFGSFGDIITILDKLDQIRRTLVDDQGSYSEFKSLVDEIDQFTRSLEFLESVRIQFTNDGAGVTTPISRPGGQSSNTLDAVVFRNHLRTLQGAVSASRAIAQELHDALVRYDIGKLSTESGWRRWWKTMWYMICWTLSSPRKEADSFRGRLVLQSANVSQVLLAFIFAAYVIRPHS